MPRYVLDILIRGTDRASGSINSVSRSLGRIFQIASGILVAGTIRFIADGLRDLGRSAIESFANLERMQVGLESLIARELSMPETIETIVTSIHNLTDEEILELDKLTVSIFDLNEELGELQEKHQEAIDEFGEGSVEALRFSVAIREVQAEIASTSEEYDKLAATEGKLVSATKTTFEETMSLADALKAARGPAEQLTKWVVRLSLTTPFTEQDITETLRLAAGYGFVTQYAAEAGSEQEKLRRAQEDGVVTAQRFTVAMLDFVAALGLQSEDLVRVVRAIAQVEAKGKLAGEEIRQLTNAGVGFALMARAMGMTVEEFTNLQKEGKILAEDFVPALIELIEKDLAGSAERMAYTFGGLLTNLRKVIDLILREFFGPTFLAIKPALKDLFLTLSSEDFLANVAVRGERFTNWLIGIKDQLTIVRNLLRDLSDFHFDDLIIESFADPLEEAGLDELADKLTDAALAWNDLLPKLQDMDFGFEEPEQAVPGALSAGGTALSFLGTLGLLKTLARPIGAILGFIASKLNLVVLAISILGAIWAGNWFGIRDRITEAWNEDIKPALENLWAWLQVEVPRAIETARDWVEETLVPAFQTFWEKLNDDVIPLIETFVEEKLTLLEEKFMLIKGIIEEDVIPAFVTWVEQLRGDVTDAINELKEIIDPDVTGTAPNGFRRWAEILTDRIIPALDEFMIRVGGPIVSVLVALGATVLRLKDESFEPWFEVLREGVDELLPALEDSLVNHILPAFGDVEGILANITEIIAVLAGGIIGGLLLPVFELLSEFLIDPLLPLFEEMAGLLGDISRIGLQLALGYIANIIVPTMNWWADQIRDKLNFHLKFTRWLLDVLTGKIESDSPLVKAIQIFAGFFLNMLKNSLNNTRDAIDRVRSGIERLRDALNSLTMPWWAVGQSPPPAADFFNDIADSVERVSNVMGMNPLGRATRLSIASPFSTAQRAAMASASGSGGAVTIQGDQNTFYVQSDGQGRMIAQMISEKKKERFNHYMGRT